MICDHSKLSEVLKVSTIVPCGIAMVSGVTGGNLKDVLKSLQILHK